MSAHLLAQLIGELETQATLSPEVARWLHAGACQFQAGRARCLSLALGLRGRGIALPATQAAKNRRNAHLRAAFVHVVGATEHQRLEVFRGLIRRFATDTWPRLRTLSAPPATLNALQRELFHAFATGIDPPRSHSQMAAIIGEIA